MKYSYLSLVSIIASPVFAQSSDRFFDMNLDELLQVSIVTSASGFEQSPRHAPAKVTIVTQDEWQLSGARTLSDVLSSIVGIHIGESPLQYKHKKIFIRGLSGDYSSNIRILIDGRPFENLQDSGVMNGFHLPLAQFKQIEVVKGPVSAIYGADAFAGVINLISHDQETATPEMGLRLGSFNSVDFFARGSVQSSGSKLAVSLDYMKSRDDTSRQVEHDLQSTLDGVLNTQASNAPGRYDEHYEVIMASMNWDYKDLNLKAYTWRNLDIGLGGGIAQALDPVGSASSEVNSVSLSYDWDLERLGELTATYEFRQQWNKSFLYVFPAGAVIPIGASGNVDFVEPTTVTLFKDGLIGTPSSGGTVNSYKLTHLFEASADHFIRWEVGFENVNFRATESKNFGPSVLQGNETMVDDNLTSVTGTPYIYLPKASRDFYYASMQDEWRLNDTLTLTLGLRYDHYSDFGDSTSPRLGLVWTASDALTFKFLSGKAINSPSFVQLYSQNNPVGIGDPNLTPEKLAANEITMSHSVNENFHWSLALFQYKAEDLIEYTPNAELKGNLATNIGTLDGTGGELSFSWKPKRDLSLMANMSYQDTSVQSGAEVFEAPTFMVSVAANYQINSNWYWHNNIKWLDARSRQAQDVRDELEAYALVKSGIRYKSEVPGWAYALFIDNLLDEKAAEPSNGHIPDDYPIPGRRIEFEVAYRF